jgi:hypothetical protein
MKGSVGIGLLVGIVAAMFLPHVFAMINVDIFGTLSGIIKTLELDTLGKLICPAFPGVFSPLVFNPNFFKLWTIDFIYLLPAILAWFVSGLLAALFAQSPKKGVLVAVVFIVVEVLLYFLFQVIAGGDLLTLITDDIAIFVGGVILTPFVFGLLGGMVGGFISKFAFGPEEI